MADTEQHFPPGGQIFDEIPLDEEIDWRNIDRLIVLMSLTVTLHFLRRKKRINMPERIKFQVMKRMKVLIDAYKRPTKRRKR